MKLVNTNFSFETLINLINRISSVFYFSTNAWQRLILPKDRTKSIVQAMIAVNLRLSCPVTDFVTKNAKV